MFKFHAKTWKQPKCPSTEEWIEKMWYIYTMEYYSDIKRNETGSFVEMWMNLETVIQNEDREKQILHNITYMWNLENGIDELICKTVMETQR